MHSAVQEGMHCLVKIRFFFFGKECLGTRDARSKVILILIRWNAGMLECWKYIS